ncbi:MAG: ATP-binding cassette domain-containing protein [Chitinispirillaceae bacterium]|nr:ATP-binding cassette domain-containing protein [Chitinispirillaceae bacterium]
MITVTDLSKSFYIHRKEPGFVNSVKSLFVRKKTAIRALDDVSLSIGEGEIVGLIGANGAGKTTLVKILSGIIHPDGGSVRVLGSNPWQRKNSFRSAISLIMGQKAQLWWDLPAADCFLLLREIYRIPDKEYRERLDFLASTLAVTGQLTTQIRRLSLGERMKMELIAALLHNPKVVFLDEPTIGLDLTAQKAIRSFILSYRDKHHPAMIITSHYMEDIKSLCKRIIILRKGAVVYDGELAHIVSDHAPRKIITVRLDETDGMADLSHSLPEHLGTFTRQVEKTLEFSVPRTLAAEAASHLLRTLPVEDLTINEPDIGIVIESIMRDG